MKSTSRSSDGVAQVDPCSLPRRLAAIFYDAFLLFALLMAATFVVVVPLRDAVSADNLFFKLYLLTVGWAYFAVSWRGGQTLGMMAWRIHIVGRSRPMSWLDTAVRYLVSILSWLSLGLGFLWSLFHPQKASWHDLASGSRLVHIPLNKPGAMSEKSAAVERESAQIKN